MPDIILLIFWLKILSSERLHKLFSYITSKCQKLTFKLISDPKLLNTIICIKYVLISGKAAVQSLTTAVFFYVLNCCSWRKYLASNESKLLRLEI